MTTRDPDRRQTILFYTPEAGVVPHLAGQCMLGHALQQAGHRVLFLQCRSLFSRCPVMDMGQLPHDAPAAAKRKACSRCRAASDALLKAYGLEGVPVAPPEVAALQARVEALRAHYPDDLREFTFESFRFGLAAAHDVVLATKRYDFERADAAMRGLWEQYVDNSLVSYLLAQDLCARFGVTRIVHFNDYSLLLGARFAGAKLRIPALSVTYASHMNQGRRFVAVSPTIWREAFYAPIAQWGQWRDLYLDGAQVKEVGDDLLGRLGAVSSHSYSPPKTFSGGDPVAQLGLSPEKPLVVAYTSSYDELIAGQYLMDSAGRAKARVELTFPDQREWLRALTARFESRDDLQLIVRIHPREGRNKRESTRSEHLHTLIEEFQRPYRNCRFVWPEDPVSSYDLAEQADLALISWSTIGLELARLGVPVLAMNRGTTYPGDDFIEYAATPDEYFSKMAEMLVRPMTLATVARSFRLYNCFNLGHALPLRRPVPASALEGKMYPGVADDGDVVSRVVVDGTDPLALNLHRQRSLQTPSGCREEEQALAAQLRRLVHFLYTGKLPQADFELLLVASPEHEAAAVKRAAAGGVHVLSTDGRATRYLVGRKSYQRRSPLCARLARLCAQPPGTGGQPASGGAPSRRGLLAGWLRRWR